MQQASDFLAESEALEQLIAPLHANNFDHPTGFKSWTFETIMRHHGLYRRLELRLNIIGRREREVRHMVPEM